MTLRSPQATFQPVATSWEAISDPIPDFQTIRSILPSANRDDTHSRTRDDGHRSRRNGCHDCWMFFNISSRLDRKIRIASRDFHRLQPSPPPTYYIGNRSPIFISDSAIPSTKPSSSRRASSAIKHTRVGKQTRPNHQHLGDCVAKPALLCRGGRGTAVTPDCIWGRRSGRSCVRLDLGDLLAFCGPVEAAWTVRLGPDLRYITASTVPHTGATDLEKNNVF